MPSHRKNIFKPVIALFFVSFILDGIQARCHSLFDCNVQFKCSDKKEYVWATDEERCYVFQNRCLLRVEQCARRNEGRSELNESEKETCKKTCDKICTKIFEPVCAQFFQEEYITFSNECEMRNYMCSKERAYSYYAIGECVEQPHSN